MILILPHCLVTSALPGERRRAQRIQPRQRLPTHSSAGNVPQRKAFVPQSPKLYTTAEANLVNFYQSCVPGTDVAQSFQSLSDLRPLTTQTLKDSRGQPVLGIFLFQEILVVRHARTPVTRALREESQTARK